MGSIFSTGKTNMATFIISGLLPFPFSLLAHLYIRIMDYNGSLDRWWIFLLLLIPIFWIFPFTFIPLLGLYTFNGITDGPGLNPLDFSILIPIVLYVILDCIIPLFKFILPNIILNIIKVLLVYLSIVGINIYRRYKNCNSDEISKNNCNKVDAISFFGIGKAFLDGLVLLGCAEFSIENILSSIPLGPISFIVGLILNAIPEFILWSFRLLIGYFFINSINNFEICKFCTGPMYHNTLELIPAIISCITIYIKYIVMGKSYNNEDEDDEEENEEENDIQQDK